MRLARAIARTVLAAAALSCRSVGSAPAAPDPAPVPLGEPRPFAALFRLDCCGQRDLLATVRGDGSVLSVAVAAGPAGTVVEAWLQPQGGFQRDGGERCLQPLTGGLLPLAGGTVLPLDPRLAALLLSGVVPRDAHPAAAASGWFESGVRDLTVRWRVERGTVTAAEIHRAGDRRLLLAVTMAEHHGRVPGRLSFRAGTDAGELRLVEWRFVAAPVEPAWLAWRTCGVAP
jgi:hypothetical protein